MLKIAAFPLKDSKHTLELWVPKDSEPALQILLWLTEKRIKNTVVEVRGRYLFFSLYMREDSAFRLLNVLKTRDDWKIEAHDAATSMVKDECDTLLFQSELKDYQAHLERQYSAYCDREALLVA